MFAKVLVLVLLATSFAYGKRKQEERNNFVNSAALCQKCVEFMDEMSVLLSSILDEQSDTSSCNQLCGYLPQSQSDCLELCNIGGVEDFVHAISNSEAPLRICVATHICSFKKHAAGKIQNVNVDPTSAAEGSIFTFNVSYEVTSEIGTGEVHAVITSPSGKTIHDSQILIQYKKGVYNSNFEFDTRPSESESFEHGTYNVVFELCEGSCLSHKQRIVLDESSPISFTITN